MSDRKRPFGDADSRMTKSQILTLKKWITSYPELFGACIGLLIVIAIIAMVKWAPGIDDALDRHNTFVRDVWCTQALFVTTLVRFWPLRRRAAFWMSLTVLLAFHSLGIFLYRYYVHPLLLSQWTILIAVEVFIIFFIVPWLTRQFSRHDRRGPHDLNPVR
jgi:hypothetical protein